MWSDPRFIITVFVIGIAAAYDFGITWLLLRDHLTQIETDMIAVIVGSLNTNGLVTGIQYWLGSSHSSQSKDATIASQAEALKK